MATEPSDAVRTRDEDRGFSDVDGGNGHGAGRRQGRLVTALRRAEAAGELTVAAIGFVVAGARREA